MEKIKYTKPNGTDVYIIPTVDNLAMAEANGWTSDYAPGGVHVPADDVIAAIGQVDMSNPENVTPKGMPKLAAVSELAGRKVSKAELATALKTIKAVG
jgi:hypothetical protein